MGGRYVISVFEREHARWTIGSTHFDEDNALDEAFKISAHLWTRTAVRDAEEGSARYYDRGREVFDQ